MAAEDDARPGPASPAPAAAGSPSLLLGQRPLPGPAPELQRRGTGGPSPTPGPVPLPRVAVSKRVSPVPASLPNGHFGKQQGIAELWGQSVAGGPAPCAARWPQPACGGRSVGHCGAESHVPLDLRAALGTDRPRPPVPPGAAHFPSPVSGTEVTGWRWEAGREVVLWVTLVLAWGTPKAAGDASFPRGHAANPSHPTQDAPPHRAWPACFGRQAAAMPPGSGSWDRPS